VNQDPLSIDLRGGPIREVRELRADGNDLAQELLPKMEGPGLTGKGHRLVVDKAVIEAETQEQRAAKQELAKLQQEDRHEAQKRQAREREAERKLVRKTIKEAKEGALLADADLGIAITAYGMALQESEAADLSHEVSRGFAEAAEQRVRDLRARLDKAEKEAAEEARYEGERWCVATSKGRERAQACLNVAHALEKSEAAWQAVNGAFRKAHRDRAARRRAHEILGTTPTPDGAA
jgi:hypothetical protein